MFWDNLAVAANFFVEIAVELIVLFIGITFLVGLIQEYVPDETIKKALGGRHKILGSILGAGFGALTPFCSCSTIPLLLGMLNAGVPFASAMAFLFASPLLNPVIISSVHHSDGLEGSCALLCRHLRGRNCHRPLA